MSIVSVSRTASALPHRGQTTSCLNVGWASSGEPCTLKSRSSGSRTGSWSRGTPTSPQAAQCTTGIGAPHDRWREMSQSRSR